MNKEMKKKLKLLLLLCFVLCVPMGCGNKDEKANASEKTETSIEVNEFEEGEFDSSDFE